MKKHQYIRIILLLVALPLLGLSATAKSSKNAKDLYETIVRQGTEYECDIPIFIDNNGDCGYVAVPIDYENVEKGYYNIFWYKFSPRDPSEAPNENTVIPLIGGPGISSSYHVLDYLFTTEWKQIRETFTILGFDYRATGLSEPYDKKVYHACNNSYVARYDRFEERMLTRCSRKISRSPLLYEGISSKNITRDLATLMDAHDIEHAVLLGASYGTRVALTAMREIPERVRGAVFDGTLPIEVNIFTQPYVGILDNLRHIMQVTDRGDDLDEETSATSVSSGTREKFIQISDKLRDYDPDVARDMFVKISEMAYYNNLPWLMDRYYEQVRHHVLYALKDLTHIIQASDPPYEIYNLDVFDDQSLSILQYRKTNNVYMLSILLAEEYVFIEEQPHDEPNPILEPDVFSLITEYEYGPITVREAERAYPLFENLEISPIEKEAVRSPIPVLLIGGMRDIITPVRWAKQTVDNLPNSRLFIFYQYGHVPSLHAACTMKFIIPFIENPNRIDSLSVDDCYDEVYGD